VLVLDVRHADPVSLVHYQNVLLTKQAVAKLEKILG
jgi:large subunit ribosomal protein L4